MSQLGQLLILATDPATQFVSAIAQNAGEYLGLNATSVLGLTGRGRVQHVALRTVENKDWELYFFGSSAHNSGTIALNKYLGRVEFVAANGKQIAASGLYLYDKTCDIPVRDEERTGLVHLVLVNRSTVTTAGASRIAIELSIDPTHGA